jgi:hypothetical protein
MYCPRCRQQFTGKLDPGQLANAAIAFVEKHRFHAPVAWVERKMRDFRNGRLPEQAPQAPRDHPRRTREWSDYV